MRDLLDQQRASFARDGFVSAEVRIGRLDRALSLIHDHQTDLVASLESDFGNRSRHQTLMSDVYATMESLKYAKKHVRTWMKGEKRTVGLPLSLFGGRGHVEYQPKGVVGVLGTWNFPVNLIFSPLAGVFAAGNRAMVKCSELAPATAALLEQLIASRFDPVELACVTGGPEVGAAFSALPFDHLCFTGSTRIGKQVMRAAAANLTPVTLELGGKSPVIIAPDANLEDAAIRIMTGKALNSGQACLGPDYVMVARKQLGAFVGFATSWTERMFPTVLDNPDYCAVINERHYRRLCGYVDEARAHGASVHEVNPANEGFAEQTGPYRMPLTLIVDPDDDLSVAQEEIFGPVLVIKTYDQLDDCIEYVNARPRPLGLYLFSRSTATQRKVLDETQSGGVCINDVMVHASLEQLPFGGVGPSGMGHYRGLDGFRTFSHARSVYRQGRVNLQRLAGMVPPFGERTERVLRRMTRKD